MARCWMDDLSADAVAPAADGGTAVDQRVRIPEQATEPAADAPAVTARD